MLSDIAVPAQNLKRIRKSISNDRLPNSQASDVSATQLTAMRGPVAIDVINGHERVLGFAAAYAFRPVGFDHLPAEPLTHGPVDLARMLRVAGSTGPGFELPLLRPLWVQAVLFALLRIYTFAAVEGEAVLGGAHFSERIERERLIAA